MHMFRFFFLFFLIPFSSFAQYPSLPSYPKNYFRNPLDIPIDLSGNFGELRPNHYHMGLDLKTLRRENLPVHAAADGFVSRIKIEPFGFGRAIYITHPNGYTTVYCHLNDFSPAIEAFTKDQQYAEQSWELYKELPPGKFPVKKGEIIAYSGNTGGSQAAHLHFEIRRTTDDVNLNPMLFGLPLQDDTRPSLLRLAIYDRSRSVYAQRPRLIALGVKGVGQWAAIAQTVSSPRISLAITAYDTHTGSSNLNGIFEAVLYDNDKAVIGFRMDGIGYDVTRYLNAHIDYGTKAAGGAYLQHLSELPGYKPSIYTRFSGDGVLDLSDLQEHRIRIEVKDAYGNTAVASTSIRYDGKPLTIPVPNGKRFYPGMLDIFESPECEFVLGEKAMYDSVNISYRSQPTTVPLVFSNVHSIGTTGIPIQDSILVRIKAVKEIPAELQQHMVMQRFAGTKKEVRKLQWENGWASSSFREFGSFQLVLDTTPPVIRPIGWTDGSKLGNVSRMVFTVDDNLDERKVTRILLDGKWIRFTNDKARNFVYRFDEKCPPGNHQLLVIAFDEAGNRTEKLFQFSR